MAGLAQLVEQVEMYLYVISHLMMMQEYELLRCDVGRPCHRFESCIPPSIWGSSQVAKGA